MRQVFSTMLRSKSGTEARFQFTFTFKCIDFMQRLSVFDFRPVIADDPSF